MKSRCFTPYFQFLYVKFDRIFCYIIFFILLDQMLALHFDFKQLSYFPDQGQFPESESGMDAPPIFWVILSDLNVMIRDIHFWKGYGPWISKQAFLKSYLSVLAQEASDKAGEHGDPPLPWVRVILR